MDLIKELKIAITTPLNFKNLLIIFFHIFLVLIVGLSMLVLVKFFFLGSSARTACTTPKTTSVKSSVTSVKNVVYKINFSGNEKCFMQSWFTWANDNKDLSLWVYDPSGNVSIIDSTKTQPNLNYFSNSPLIKGDWRLIVKTTSKTKVYYSGEIAIR
mgnify:CR=1 FL=1